MPESCVDRRLPINHKICKIINNFLATPIHVTLENATWTRDVFWPMGFTDFHLKYDIVYCQCPKRTMLYTHFSIIIPFSGLFRN
jgi:hypothetical protein